MKQITTVFEVNLKEIKLKNGKRKSEQDKIENLNHRHLLFRLRWQDCRFVATKIDKSIHKILDAIDEQKYKYIYKLTNFNEQFFNIQKTQINVKLLFINFNKKPFLKTHSNDIKFQQETILKAIIGSSPIITRNSFNMERKDLIVYHTISIHLYVPRACFDRLPFS